ncbi:MAG: hypothetical protein U0841_32285 [Chloroflexia bacterium]
MFGRLVLALIAGLAIGIIIVGGGLYLTKPDEGTPSGQYGDPKAAYDLSLTVTEAFFTTQVNKPPADTTGTQSQSTSLKEAQVRLREDGTIEVQGKASAYGFVVPVQAVVQPRVVNGKIEMEILRGQAGGLTVPQSVADDIETIINRQIANTLSKNQFQIIALQPGPGMLNVRLK